VKIYLKAIVWVKYGPVDGLQLSEVVKPEPKDKEVRIKIYATTVSMGDCEIRSLKVSKLFRIPLRIYFGIRKPKKIILGQELAGEIESIGTKVTKFKVGDQVIAQLGFNFGGYAEYTCLSENASIVLKPETMSFNEAATLPTWAPTALHFLQNTALKKGQKILINGAGGCIGIFAVQLAKNYGAEVTAVDRSDKLRALQSLGADHVIDYTREDFTKNGKKYDVIFDVVGKSSYSKSLKSLEKQGYYLLGNPTMMQKLRGTWTSIISSKKVISSQPAEFTKYLLQLNGLIKEGKLRTYVDKTYPLEQIPQAHRYVESGEKIGHVVIEI